ncbi:hypothetical protein C1H46_033626 [Malus baccata]|uniref:Uncharacterized protein n=1 Tax=Malus baccata TaxID=106549 RepID=A0A540L2T9_MALBA|nr:hypothetical protein C1H46_033626 [Malus baccata]
MEIQTVRRQAQSRLLCRFFSTSFMERRIWSAGWQEEEEELVMSMPEKPNWVRTHGDLRRGNLAFKHFTELEPMSSDRYKVAGSMFADAGENENATEIWKLIGENELEITRGMSFIKIDGAVHEVVVWTIHHSRHKEIYVGIGTPFFTLEDRKTAKNGSPLMDMLYS